MDERELRRLRDLNERLRKQVQPALSTTELQRQAQAQLGLIRGVQMPPEMIRKFEQLRFELGAGLRFQPPDGWFSTFRPLQDWFVESHDQLVAALAPVRSAYRRTLPDNLKSLDSKVLADAVALMAQDDGVVVVWLPPSDVVVRLVEAASLEERDIVVVDSGAEIATSAGKVLDSLDAPHLQILRTALVEAWAVWSDGHRLAAQALATAALGTVVHEMLAYEKFASLKHQWRNGEPLDQISLFEMRWGLLMVRTAIAVEHTDQKIPGYNRHGSAHRVEPEHYSEANALYALMLVTAWARELQATHAEEQLPPN